MMRRMRVSQGVMQRIEERDGFTVLLDLAREGLLPTGGPIQSPDGVVHMIIGDFTYCDHEWSLDHYTMRKNWRLLDANVAPTCFVCAQEFFP